MPSTKSNLRSTKPQRLGYLGLADAGPLIAAREQGFFEQEGLRVELSREVGWATIRDKVLTGELDAAQAPAPMLWAARLGIGAPAFPAASAFILNLHGNAICLSNRLRVWGVSDGASLRREALSRRGERKLVFGVVYPFSSHNLQLRAWLSSLGLVPDRDVRIAIVPPAQMIPTLKAGAIDGFMAGEPWTSMAVYLREGWCANWSGALFPGHIEKVLMTRDEHIGTETHAALLRALQRSCKWCDQPENRDELCCMLSASDALKLPVEILRASLCGPYDFGLSRSEAIPDFHIFYNGGANTPSIPKAASLHHELASAGLLPQDCSSAICSRLFRPDVLSKALVGEAANQLTHAN